MGWDSFELENNLIGERIKSGSGYFERESRFITLPENEIYEAGYGFYMSAKLAGERSVSIPDDLKVELQMSPLERETGKRYKRYKLTGSEIKETVFFPYCQIQEERKREKEKEKDRRNKRVMGKIVYGWYKGNSYEGSPDWDYAAFFYNGLRYYNPNHQKVQNVKVAFTIIGGVSKYFFDKTVDLINERMAAMQHIEGSVAGLKRIKEPSKKVLKIIKMLEAEKEDTIKALREELAQKNKKGEV